MFPGALVSVYKIGNALKDIAYNTDVGLGLCRAGCLMQGLWSCFGKQYKQGGWDNRGKAKGKALAYRDIKGSKESHKDTRRQCKCMQGCMQGCKAW